MPSVVAPKAYKARATVQAALCQYYAKKYDLEPDVARITKVRWFTSKFSCLATVSDADENTMTGPSDISQKAQISIDDIGNTELGLLFASTANAIPTLFWFVAFVAADPTLVVSLRDELLPTITVSQFEDGKREGQVNTTSSSLTALSWYLATAGPSVLSTYCLELTV